MRMHHLAVPLALAAAASGTVAPALAASHREAPFITTSPKADGTDFYLFRSYEGIAANGSGGRSDFVTVIANYLPLQDAYGGPNYFSLDPNALYEIHIDNNGDAQEDLSFQFRFQNKLNDIAVPVGSKSVAIPLIQAGAVANVNDANLNLNETYTVTLVRGDRRRGSAQAVSKTGGGASFEKPVDYIGVKTLGDAAAYATYAGRHVHEIRIPGCPAGKDTGRVFVGQRQEGFAVNLGPIFDLVNAPLAMITNPANINTAAANSIQNKNVTSIALEVHKDCLAAGGDPVIGGWTTASLRQARLLNGQPAAGHQASEKAGGAWAQVSRLGQPLVNEVVIGLKDKDRFNAAKPKDDAQFLDYVTHPTLPPLLGLVLAGNAAAPKDDVVDIALVAMLGGLCMANGDTDAFKFNSIPGVPGVTSACKPSSVPTGATSLDVHDAVDQAVVPFLPGFPYLNTPNPGSR